MARSLRIIFRGDDAGSARSANLALHECAEHGVLRNIGFMAPGPGFAHAAEQFGGAPTAGAGFGLHVTLSSEWDHPKWGPVLPAARVPSLVDGNGHFTPAPNVLHGRGFSVAEALAEIEAQLDRTLGAGLPIEYIDEHMGVSWIHPGLRAGIAALAERRGLVDAHGVPGLPPAPARGANVVEDWCARLEHAAANGGGTFVVVSHPTLDDEEMRAYTGANMPPGELARQRDRDRRALLDPRLRETCERLGVERIRYRDVARG